MRPLISIITPTFNPNLDFFSLVDKSVRNQTLQENYFEWIVMDDGSREDNSNRIKEVLKGKETFKFYRRKKNKGPSITRNEAIDISCGRLIALLDADDILLPCALEKTLEFHESNKNIKYSYSMMNIINEKGILIKQKPSYEYDKEKLTHFNYIGHLKCFDKTIHKKINGFNPQILLAQDWDHVLKASEILGEDQIARNPIYLYNYREHSKGISKGNQKIRQETISKFLVETLKRRGINTNVYWSHKTTDNYNYYDWRKNESSCNT